MIDWIALAFNALWILGCAILLAQFSVSRWLKQQQLAQQSALTRLIVSSSAYLLIGIGVIVVNPLLWQKAVWLIVVILLIGSEYLNFKSVQ